MRLLIALFAAAIFVSLVSSPIAGAATSSQMLQAAPAASMVSPLPVPAGANQLYSKLITRVPPRLMPWISQEARSISLGQTDGLNWPSPTDPMLAGMNLSGGDIEELAFIVMMQATNDMDQDLKNIMDQVKAQDAAKQQLREQMNQVNALAANAAKNVSPSPSPAGNLPPTAAQLKLQYDKLNEMSETTSQRLQTCIDRRSKLVSTISLVMKRIANTSDMLIRPPK